MTDNNDEIIRRVSTNWLPMELWVKILRSVPPKQLTICSDLCSYWESILKEYDTIIWKDICRNEYPNIYEDLYRKTNPTLTWQELYRSLLLWTDSKAIIISDCNIVFKATDMHKIQYSIQNNGEVAVWQWGESYIDYYESSKIDGSPSRKETILSSFLDFYDENKYLIVGVNSFKIFIKSKLSGQPFLQLDLINSYNDYIIIRKLYLNDETVFIVTNHEVYTFRIDKDRIVQTLLYEIPNKNPVLKILFLSYTDCLNIFIRDRQELSWLVYSLRPTGMVTKEVVDKDFCTFYNLVNYNILGSYLIELRKCPRGSLDSVYRFKQMSVAEQYGDIIVAGMGKHDIHIYRKPNLKPTKKTKLEPIMVFKLEVNVSNVEKIEIVEIRNGHKLYLSLYHDIEQITEVMELTLTHV